MARKSSLEGCWISSPSNARWQPHQLKLQQPGISHGLGQKDRGRSFPWPWTKVGGTAGWWFNSTRPALSNPLAERADPAGTKSPGPIGATLGRGQFASPLRRRAALHGVLMVSRRASPTHATRSRRRCSPARKRKPARVGAGRLCSCPIEGNKSLPRDQARTITIIPHARPRTRAVPRNAPSPAAKAVTSSVAPANAHRHCSRPPLSCMRRRRTYIHAP